MKTSTKRILLVLALGTVLPAIATAAEPYGTRVQLVPGKPAAFPDFQLSFLGPREDTSKADPLTFYDFAVTGETAQAQVSLGGPGGAAAQPFCFGGRRYHLERAPAGQLPAGQPAAPGAEHVIVRRGEPETACRFRLHVLEADWWQLTLGPAYGVAWPQLRRAASVGRSLMVIEPADVDVYDSAGPSLTLTADATRRLLEAAIAAVTPTDSHGKIRTRMKDGNPQWGLERRGFVIEAEGQPLVGGIFLHPESLAPRYPSINIEVVNGRAVFHFRSAPLTPAEIWDGGVPKAPDPEVAATARRMEAEIARNPAGGGKLDPFKDLFVEPRIASLFRELGKWRPAS